MRYLRDSDYLDKITENDLFALVEDETSPKLLILSCELKAQEQISLFLRKRYNLAKLFETFADYKTGITYSTGQTVWYSNDTESSNSSHLYRPKISTSTLPTTFDWEQVDPRYTSIVDWMTSISIYKLHERISPDAIPKHRKDSYEEGMKFLESIQKGKVSPVFPEIENRIQNIYVGGIETNGIGYNY